MYSEKERVPLFKQVCDSSASATEKTQQLAQLMNDSQDSCRYVVLTFADGRGACVKGRDVLRGLSSPDSSSLQRGTVHKAVHAETCMAAGAMSCPLCCTGCLLVATILFDSFP